MFPLSLFSTIAFMFLSMSSLVPCLYSHTIWVPLVHRLKSHTYYFLVFCSSCPLWLPLELVSNGLCVFILCSFEFLERGEGVCLFIHVIGEALSHHSQCLDGSVSIAIVCQKRILIRDITFFLCAGGGGENYHLLLPSGHQRGLQMARWEQTLEPIMIIITIFAGLHRSPLHTP